MKIGTREVGPGRPTFIIAEIGSNHAGSLDMALALIDAAAAVGADAAKFQYFRVDRFLVPRPDPEALRKYELPDAWLPQLKARCTERGIEFLCTAFDYESLDAIDPFVDAHKIGSAEAEDYDYCEVVLDRGKPTIISLGMHDSYDILPPWRADPGTLFLVCESSYPAKIDGYLRDEQTLLVDPWGVSDHTLDPLTVPCAAVALGACVVEKHVRLEVQMYRGERERPPDYDHSVTVSQFGSMVAAIRKTERAIR